MPDPISTGALIGIMAGGKVLDGILGYFTGLGEEELAEMDLEFKREQLAKTLGLQYDQLKEQARQYDMSLKQRMDEFAKSHKLDKASLAETIRKNNQEFGLGKEKLGMERSFGVSDRLSAMGQNKAKEDRLADSRNFFTPRGRPTIGVKPTASGTTQTSTAGSTALRSAQTGVPQTGGPFPLSGQV